MSRWLIHMAVWGVVAFAAVFAPAAQAHSGPHAQLHAAHGTQAQAATHYDTAVQKQPASAAVTASAGDSGVTFHHGRSCLGCCQMCGACCAAALASDAPSLDFDGRAGDRRFFEHAPLTGAPPQALRKPPRFFV